ncbi:MAG TPA: type III-A CRISPR-associated RAMP protein Csm3 [Chthonomonadaceae bacterium]|nr:type III-A CRISPR-associated RAMP protein Csm3 [Chthonomonadaceae bacterium]
MKKVEHFTIQATIECLSGLRIGGSDNLLQIGGTDLTCIKHPVTLQPYIPGSSLKGKMRSELEKAEGKFSGQDGNEPCDCGGEKCPICRIFGPHKKAQHDLGPSRIIVRDATLVSGGQIETKTENIIDRRVGTALHPRKVERVVSGSTFNLNIGVQVWDLDQNFTYQEQTGGHALFKVVRYGMYLVEKTGLGAGVSKGYGRVAFRNVKVARISLDKFPDEWSEANATLSA